MTSWPTLIAVSVMSGKFVQHFKGFFTERLIKAYAFANTDVRGSSKANLT